MNAAQIHLALNHLPIGLVLVGAPLLLAALIRKSKELRVAATVLFILSAATAVPVFLSGEPAEEVVEHRAGISKSVIHEHEEAGEFSLIFVGILGAIAFGAGLYEHFKTNLPNSVWFGIFLLGLVSIGIFVRTAHLGGLIHHDELNSETSDSVE